eukprot:9897327-Lingulodinium_polyedra.AAC.1
MEAAQTRTQARRSRYAQRDRRTPSYTDRHRTQHRAYDRTQTQTQTDTIMSVAILDHAAISR